MTKLAEMDTAWAMLVAEAPPAVALLCLAAPPSEAAFAPCTDIGCRVASSG